MLNKKIIKIFFYSTTLCLISAIVSYADVIGCDIDGIICLNDNLDIYSNEYRTLDLDFDGQYEKYYFDSKGRLKTNAYVNENYLNENGQLCENGKVEVVDIGIENKEMYQVDNTNYYYISQIQTKFTDSFDNMKVEIDMPKVTGEGINAINEQLKTRGLELLKIYAKNEAYKRDTKKLQILINVFNKNEVQRLNFIPNYNKKFYFNFDVIINLNNKKTLRKNVGLCVDEVSCKITNYDLQKLNDKTYEHEEEIKIGKYATNRYKEYFDDLTNEYIRKLFEYIDTYNDYISKYENGERIQAINNFIKNIDTVYTKYVQIAKKDYNNYEIDLETYRNVESSFKIPLEEYRNILIKNLSVEINAIKELEIEKHK